MTNDQVLRIEALRYARRFSDGAVDMKALEEVYAFLSNAPKKAPIKGKK